MILILGVIGMVAGVMMINSDEPRHQEWKRRNPNATWYPGSVKSTSGSVIAGLALFLFLLAFDSSSQQFILEAIHDTF